MVDTILLIIAILGVLYSIIHQWSVKANDLKHLKDEFLRAEKRNEKAHDEIKAEISCIKEYILDKDKTAIRPGN